MERLKTAQIFTSNMVLQRNQNVRVWGKGRKNSTVSVQIGEHKLSVRVIECEWSVELPRMEAGGPYTMTITDGLDVITYYNVMVGEVWLAGGQSNMEMELQNCQDGVEETKNADCEMIRFYNTAKIATLDPDDLEEEAKSRWLPVKPYSAGKMSAVAYFYAKEVQKKLGVAVGIIDCYWGGSSVCCWISDERIECDLDAHIYTEEWRELVGDQSIEEYEYEVELFRRNQRRWIDESEELKLENPNITMWEINKLIGDCPWEHPFGNKSPYRPSGLYYTMIERVAPYKINGVLWYQGEQDAGKAEIYHKMLMHLIYQWREAWQDEALPFYIVQLPMWIDKNATDDKSWAVMREAQRLVTERVKNTYLTVLSDCGEYDNIHPLDKKIVGYRLAMQVLKYSYKYKELYVEGPRYLQRDLKDGRIVLYFEHVDGGFVIKGNEEIDLFEIAGDDKEFKKANAVIVGDTIEVSNEEIKNPKYARYAWTNYGIVNLFNAKGLPLAPFATI